MSKSNSKVKYDGIDAVDLFCGGGLTCGLRQTGIDVRMGVDFDGRCEYAYEHNNDFCQNRFWDAKSLLIKFIRRAKKELIVIDAYPGVATLDMLAKRGRGVKIELVNLRSQNVTSKIDVKEAA